MAPAQGRLAILVGGGPAPGINSAISAATIEAVNSGLDVVGVYDGFLHLSAGRTDEARPLGIGDVSRIHFQGGSILRTSRANPTKRPEDLERTVDALRELGAGYLVTIGGDDTALAAAEVARAARGVVRVAHLPKTIDNDLPLPGGAPTFGFETARHVGTQVALNLMEESRTTNRWCLAVVMGRKAGHLALAIGKAASATVTVIPEEFRSEGTTLGEICDVIEGAMFKRRTMGRRDGLAVVAEGTAARIPPEELSKVPGAEVGYDPYGNLRLEDIPLALILRREMQRRFAERGETLSMVAVTLGYEMRCAAPIPFDVDYTRTLGNGAVRRLLSDEGRSGGGLVCLHGGQLEVLPFESLRDPATGHTRTRLVDTESEHYRVARQYMIRLSEQDLRDPARLARLAEEAQTTPEEFARRYGRVVEADMLNGDIVDGE
jgi:6-phosphofructokinase